MKIDHGRTPIWVAPRTHNGVTITQGHSHLNLSEAEVHDLIDAMIEIIEAKAASPSHARWSNA
ncbi:hypothetical protein [Mycobacterium dioxanotrophicus]|uniref:hypothetical protein n=1 Tax=Mycobacterium dioxanotrophicus TaxID=482462 RepID=UPI0012FA6246|nr:hypothetical protein [Mycobacterium dioxanotrophicus]